MPAPMTELVLETILRDGLGQIKTNPNILDDIFGRLKEAHFLNQYGQNKIDEIKTFFTNGVKQLRIVHSWSQVPTHVPCYSIQLINADEEEGIQNLGNDYPEVEDPKAPEVIVASVQPTTFNVTTGKLDVNPAVDLSAVCAGMLFKDSNGTTFPIKTPLSNMSGSKYLTLESNGNTPELTLPGQVISSIDFTRYDRRMVRLREKIAIGVHSSNDLHLTKFLYYILVWILKSRQEAMINRGLTLDRGTGRVFDRDDTYQGENIYTRYLEITCISDFIWNQNEAQVFDCFDLTIKTNTPKANSIPEEPYNTSED
jgi:hypothetical protein